VVIDVTEYSDPGCPWAYSASPDLAVLRWRYGDGLRWRLVLIGLTEEREQYLRRGYTPQQGARGQRRFARYGMPFSHEVKPGVAATARMCRAVVATRLLDPALEREAFRALQFAQFNSAMLMDEEASLRAALATVPGLDVDRVVGALDSDEVTAAYEADRTESRSAEGGATEFQGKHATTDGPVRYTAPSLLFTAEDGRVLEAGGFQSLEAYDVCIANLDRTLERRGPAESAVEALEPFPGGLTTAEVAAILTPDLHERDLLAAEGELIDAVAEGRVNRRPLGDDALWTLA